MATFRFVVMFSLNSFGYVFLCLFSFVITFHNKRSSFSRAFCFLFWFVRGCFGLFACTFFFVCQTLNVNFFLSFLFWFEFGFVVLFCFALATQYFAAHAGAVRDLNVFGSVKFGFLLELFRLLLLLLRVLSVCLWHN